MRSVGTAHAVGTPGGAASLTAAVVARANAAASRAAEPLPTFGACASPRAPGAWAPSTLEEPVVGLSSPPTASHRVEPPSSPRPSAQATAAVMQAKAMVAASHVRLDEEDVEAYSARRTPLVRSPANADPSGDVVTSWWHTHFGVSAPEAVSSERLRTAAEAELGPLSSVDLQLLRLELADDRGKLTRTALRRLLSGAIDSSDGYATVASALNALLQSARAQLDRQVEVRMRQASTRPSAARASRAARSNSPAPGSSPAVVERRVQLELA
jgi:hypothetical protein